ncbi:MAG: branched-chain amino acid ABC transporter permease [Candidatus Elarobacter sp.]
MRPDLRAALIVAVVLVLPAVLPLSDYATRVAASICIFAIAATSWSILGGYANQVSLGQATLFGIGAYTSSILAARVAVSPWLGGIAGAAFAALVAIAIGSIAFRLRGHYFALVTLALAEIVRIVVQYAQPITGGANGVSLPFVANSLWLLQFKSMQPYYVLAALALAGTLAIVAAIGRAPLGYRLRAVRDDEVAAQLAGIDPFRTKLLAFAIGAALSAVAGTLYAQLNSFVDPDSVFSIALSVQIPLYAIVGGARTWWGPFAGAAILIPLAQAASGAGGAAAGIAQIGYGVILVAIIIAQPDGIAGLLQRRFHRTVKAS